MIYPQTDKAAVTPVDLPEDLARALPQLAGGSETFAHPPFFTVAEGAAYKAALPGRGTKNLFLKDRKDDYWLLTAWDETRIDLNAFSTLLRGEGLAASRLSFASPARVMAVLQTEPGHVSPLALLHDASRQVRVVLDLALVSAGRMSCHPLRNDRTTVLTPALLMEILSGWGYAPLIVDFSGVAPTFVKSP